MLYTYILQSINHKQHVYYGQTNNLLRRLVEHNAGENFSTRPYRPWKVIYFEAYASRSLAIAREKQLKHYGQARTALKKRLNISHAYDQWDREFGKPRKRKNDDGTCY